MADPRKTVQLLNQLVAIGFMNEAFQRLHHMGRRLTIAVHRAYCEKKISSFQKDSTNARVERRLESRVPEISCRCVCVGSVLYAKIASAM